MKKILVVILLFILSGLSLESSLAVDDSKIYEYWYNECCCEDSERLLERIYENQLLNEARNKPSTLEEIEDEYYKLSGGSGE